MNDISNGNSVFYLNSFKIVNCYGLWWIGDAGFGVLCGPLGTVEEARDWCNTHNPKEFQSKRFTKDT